jgi:GT2 family glycosyltransferase
MGSFSKINISVIIPTHNRKECLKTVLTCLRKQKNKNNFRLYPLVVVDGSTDGTMEMLNFEFPEVPIIIGDGNWWYTKCINKGIEYSLSLDIDYILTLNDDIVFNEQYIESLMNVIEHQKDFCLVGSVSYTQSNPCRISFSGVKKIIRWRLKEINYISKFSIVDPNSNTGYVKSMNLSGRGILFPIDLISKLGFYDEKLIQYGSDTDFSYRATKAGINVYLSYDAIIYENEKLTSKGSIHNMPSFKEYIHSFFEIHSINSMQKGLYFYWKHGYKALIPLYFVIIMLGACYNLFFKYRNL